MPTIPSRAAPRPFRATGAVIKWHGGKSYLAKKIVALMPDHLHYVEPYAGGLAVMLAKPFEGMSEVANDLDGDLATFWKVLQDPDSFARFVRLVQAVPFSENEWRDARELLQAGAHADDPVERAAAFFVFCRQSLAGRMDSFSPLSRRRVRRGMNEQASAWLTALEGLPAVHARLKRVVILNRPALEVIAQQDGHDTLFYLDPPYLHSTRAARDVYRHEMTGADHGKLLVLLGKIKGRAMLSGYPSLLYKTVLAKWKLHTFNLPNSAAGAESKSRMTECLWTNF